MIRIIGATALITLISLGSACAQTGRVVEAERCYVIEGDRGRYLQVDRLARNIAQEERVKYEGDSPAALVLHGDMGQSRVVLTSPFGAYVSVIAFYRISGSGEQLKLLERRLLLGVKELKFEASACTSVPGFKPPRIWGDF